ncbi:MAG TPA: DUF4037 domain-containing protein [Longimicrobium sp.]|jgi:hypothetical protein|uniref:DUF4037 domain-containing protein n=1 Tax=Longimicrobium sp. TaxID=2029185 RepID=UPI002EDA1C20
MAEPVGEPRVERLISDLLPVVRGFSAGPCGTALGGSWAKGGADAQSDVDVYLFCDSVGPRAERDAMVVRAFGAGAEPHSWGADEPLDQCGTDFAVDGVRVECWIRGADGVERTIAACREARIERTLSVWAVMGFFNYVALADVRAMRILDDPGGRLAGWKSLVDPYPEALRQAVLRRFTAEAAFWPRNPHYLSAVERGDAIYTSAIVQQTVQSVIQAVFALNGEYFPGEKKLASALGALAVQPVDLTARIHAILFPGAAPDAAMLRRQQSALAALVDEIAALAG